MEHRDSDGNLLSVTFAEPETLATIRAAHGAVKVAQAGLEAAERKLHLVQRNPEVIELQNKIPADEAAAARENVHTARRAVSAAMDRFRRLVLDEHRDFYTVRGSVLNVIRKDSIELTIQLFREQVASIETAINNLIDQITAVENPSVDLGSAKALDAKIETWNEFIRDEVKGPGNALVAPDMSVMLSVRNQILDAAKEVHRIDDAVARLRKTVAAARQKVGQ